MHSRLTKVTVTTAAGAAAVLLAAGCGSGSGSSNHSSAGGMSPSQAITLAANQSKQVTSFASTLNMQLSGQVTGSISGTFQAQTKPSLALNVNMNTLKVAGHTLPGGMQELLAGNTLYIKMSVLSQELGKPWVEIPLSEMQKDTGIDFTQLFQQVETSDPLVETQMFTSAKNVREVGTQNIGGVETTHYTGSFAIAAGVAKLPADMHALVSREIQTLGMSQVHFNVWIDAQHVVRKIEVTEPGSKESATVSMQITGLGQQVKIAVPPKSETANLPASALKGF